MTDTLGDRPTTGAALPWTADSAGFTIVASNGRVLAVHPGMGRVDPTSEDKAVFARIAKAVNTYDLMLTATLKAFNALEHGKPEQYEDARVALRKAITAHFGLGYLP